MNGDHYHELGRFFADVLDRGYEIYRGPKDVSNGVQWSLRELRSGLPGTEHIFDDGNIGRILRGEQFIGPFPQPLPPGHARQAHHPSGEERQRRAHV